MDYRIKDFLKSFEAESYVKDSDVEAATYDDIIDCSLGINPFGCSASFTEFKKNFFNNFNFISYPDFPYKQLKKEITSYWKNICDLDESNINFGTGSMGVLSNINKMFIEKNTVVLGNCPTFTSYVSDVKLNEGIYENIPLDPDDNYKFNLDKFIKKINSKYTLIYIDNPNNPTGQIISLSSIKIIVELAKANNICVIIDEAYGDFMNDNNSAIALVNEYDNLLVVRSFSKGFGLAGLRVGYIISSAPLSRIYSNVCPLFTINTVGQYASIQALKDKNFILESRRRISEVKQKIIESFKKLTVLETDNQVPIMTIMHPDRNVNLHKIFKMHNVLTEAGEDFPGLGRNFIRMRVPSESNKIIEIIKEIENMI